MENIKNEVQKEEILESKNPLGSVVKWVLGLMLVVLVLGSLCWMYAQISKVEKNTLNNTAFIQKKESVIDSAVATGEVNKSDIKNLQENTPALQNKIKNLEEKTLTLENKINDMLALNTQLQNMLHNSATMNGNFEKEFREVTNKQQKTIESHSENIKTQDKYYIIEKPIVPLPTEETITLPSAPSPVNETVSVPSIPLPIQNNY